MFGVREWVARAVAEKRDAMLDMLSERRDTQVFENLWLRDLHGSVVRLGEFRPANLEAVDFEAFLRRPRGEVSVKAPRAVWDDDRWRLFDGQQVVMGDVQEVSEARVFSEPEFTPKMALTFRRAQDNPLELSFGEVRELIRRDPDNIIYRTLLQYHLTFPLANLVLLLVGIPVMLGYERGRGAERMALGGLLSLFYFGTDFVFRSLGLGGGVSPLMASWMPVLAFGSLGVVLYDSMRT
jgi:lipopolysaccharide export LptBFGC system permease protein LptF